MSQIFSDAQRGALNRRSLLKAGAVTGLMLAVSMQGVVHAQDAGKKYGADSMPGGTVDDPLVFVKIATDGTVTIVAHRVEMGTGVRTSLPMVVADEMEADWARVKVVQADGDEARYGNQNVDGSRSVRHFLMPMRRVGAAARQMLEGAAAARWSVPVGEVKATLHQVVHSKTGRKLGYGELAEDAAKQPVPQAGQRRLKKESEFRYIGKDKVRAIDLEDIGRGRAKYGIDPHMPGMVFAVVARPAVLGSGVKSVNSDAALKVPGVIKVMQIPAYTGSPAFQPLGGVAVVASNTWAAMQGRKALVIEWSESEHASYDSAEYRKAMEKAAREPGKVVRNNGDAGAAWSKASDQQRVTAEYYIPHHAHASMEPPSATVLIDGDRCDVWACVQDPQNARDGVVKQLGLAKDKVAVHPQLLGGAFGRKSKADFVTEAAIIAKAMPGKPVKVVWTREDDIQHDFYHAVSLEHLEAVIGKDGMPEAWLHRTVAPTISSLFDSSAQGESAPELGMGAVNLPWKIPNFRVETGKVPAHTRIGWFRSVYNVPHAFATQCFIAELAHRAGRDHKEYALQLIGPARKLNPLKEFEDGWNYSESPEVYPLDTGRLREVIEAACKGAKWGRKLPKGRGLGLAFSYSFLTYAATVVEVEVNDKGEVRVLAADMALDCGPQITPERIRAQMEGSVIMGLSIALKSDLTFEKGAVMQSNFHQFEIARHNESPPVVRTHLINNRLQTPPGGVGEPPLPPVAPAIANAIFAATGKRMRDLPIRTLA
ncbi:xanthine dehydrogenase family protein molybdopterin-binding subunit [Diaphorobacter aerolatus]|uniref:Xanthine dehydrogenase family protein molybdopterin-binding subunit n=1 Tax=Diaphorobacter aerolatus TaxID=1288495 RepID=A0A7H0GGV0_9BURK|nr:molybdopterin cofactor-binding domain-containing protein [Diaphorobacter aerolatus]QNP47516.1 xanthine dehydrogenase family protein molybdopterin-binding subunit [Diaphorobacter aerolatus]